MKIPLRDIQPNPQQPRRDFDEAGIGQLAESIQEVGLIQPIVVEEIRPGKYYIIDGERRWRACKLIPGVSSVEVVIREELSEDKDRLAQAVVANVQRQDLNPMEEARAYKKLMVEFGLSGNRIAIMTGKNIVTVNSRLDLMDLDEKTQELVERKLLPADRRLTHALVELPVETRVKVAERLSKTNLSIKQMLKVIDKIKNSVVSTDSYRAISGVPAIKIATKKTWFDPERWNLLKQVGKVPSWELVEKAAESTCTDCALRDMASESVCKECPAVFFVLRLLNKAM